MSTDRYRLTKYYRESGAAMELYDHRIDPGETSNIAAEGPHYRAWHKTEVYRPYLEQLSKGTAYKKWLKK